MTKQYLSFLCLLFLLLTLCFLDGSGTLGSPYLCSLGPLRNNGGQISTDNATLVLYGLSRSLLCDLLSDTLLVKAAVGDGP